MPGKWQRPTVDTKFHIDMTWWQESGRDIRIYMREMLCEDCRAEYASTRTSKRSTGSTSKPARSSASTGCGTACARAAA